MCVEKLGVCNLNLGTFFEEVALRRQPECAHKSRARRVFTGARLWTRHEMPLWWAWVAFLATLGALLLVALMGEGGVADNLIAQMISIPLLVLFLLTHLLSFWVTILRGEDLLNRISKKLSE